MFNLFVRFPACALSGFAISTGLAWLAGADVVHPERGPGVLLWLWGVSTFGVVAWFLKIWPERSK